jgi:hypothetical protein
VNGAGRLARLVLALYPRSVRDQYGPEIAGLLERSRRPMRDLVDVARCAIAERARLLSYRRLRPHLNAAIGLLFAPTAFTGFYFVLVALILYAPAAVGWLLGPEAEPAIRAAATLPLVLGAIWLAGQATLPFNPAFAPTALAAGALPVAFLVDGLRGPSAAAVGIWWLAVSAASVLASATVRRVSARRAIVVIVSAGLLANELAFTVYGLVAGASQQALAIYPAVVLGIDLQWVGAQWLTVLPTLLSISTGYALRLATITPGITTVAEASSSTT